VNSFYDKFVLSVKFVGVSSLAKTQNAKYLSAINLTKLQICAMMDKAQITLFELSPAYKQSDPSHYDNLQFYQSA